ncbi:MAG: hypothetical protein AAF415_02350 [Pseudomonadota bacterium]
MTVLPAPPIADIDLRYFSTVEIDPAVMRSDAMLALSGDAFKAQTLLILAAWREFPAGSIPAGELELAHLAGVDHDGHALWGRVRSEILPLWQLCNNDRLYFEPACDAIEAAHERLKTTRMTSTARKARSRMVAELRDIGVSVSDAELAKHIDVLIAGLRARAGDGGALKGPHRRQVLIQLASEAGLLRQERGDLRPGSHGFQELGVVMPKRA